jgi:hypothetical protein
MASSCEEYRCQPQLLALKRRLSGINLEAEEREEIERLIQELERKVKLTAHRAGLPGNVDMIIGSALTPLRESVAALPAYKARHPADLPVKI